MSSAHAGYVRFADAAPVVPTPPATLVSVVFFIAITAILLGNFLGSLGAVVFLALWVLLALAYGRDSLAQFTASPWLVWVLPCFALASVLWSQSGSETLKFGLEYAATIACAVLAAMWMTPRGLVAALGVSLLLIAVLSVAIGHQSVDPLTGSVAFVGLFESKNLLGFFTSILFLAGLALMLDGGHAAPLRLAGLAAIVVSLPLLVLTRSGTSVVSVVLAGVVFLGNLMLSRMSAIARARLLFAVAVVLVPIVLLVIFGGDDVSAALLGLLGKDSTLTGRTVLWQRAAQLIPDHAWFGHGYQAFWRRDDVNAESLWHEFHVLSRQGFHFHSTYVEQAIELGYLGTGILVATLLATAKGLLAWSWRSGSVVASFHVALLFCLLTRSFVEVDVLQQFQIGTFLLAVAVTLAQRRHVPGQA